MKPRLLVLACALLAATLQPAVAGDIIDRIAATVNGHVILQSDWDDEIRFEAFMDGRSLDGVTAEREKAALDRLIDQELLHEQLRSSDSQVHEGDEVVAKRLEQIRAQYPDSQDEATWRAVLSRYNVTPGDLTRRVALQISLMRLVDDRLRPTVEIDNKSIESYYQQSLLPQLRETGAKEIPLAEVTPKIKELLTQQKVDQLLTAWLQNLRSSSQIHTGGAPGVQGQAQ